jgi:hypothetical protein
MVELVEAGLSEQNSKKDRKLICKGVESDYIKNLSPQTGRRDKIDRRTRKRVEAGSCLKTE